MLTLLVTGNVVVKKTELPSTRGKKRNLNT